MNLFVMSHLIKDSEKPILDVPVKISFLTDFHNQLFVYRFYLPTKIVSCLREMLACSGTLSYPAHPPPAHRLSQRQHQNARFCTFQLDHPGRTNGTTDGQCLLYSCVSSPQLKSRDLWRRTSQNTPPFWPPWPFPLLSISLLKNSWKIFQTWRQKTCHF